MNNNSKQLLEAIIQEIECANNKLRNITDNMDEEDEQDGEDGENTINKIKYAIDKIYLVTCSLNEILNN